MLACMCDLIVCDETAKFSSPVVLMALAGVQLLVEPWEVGARKAKELLLTGEALSAEEAWARADRGSTTFCSTSWRSGAVRTTSGGSRPNARAAGSGRGDSGTR
ncbi:MAG: hypothetical protein HY725_13590 [Candidatus Rokubacteria bacterium]|nr:hypothetical protein [Candidatus Rokubacteria bacterium]